MPAFKNLQIQVVTNNRVAYTSPDHICPCGTAQDNSTNKEFVAFMHKTAAMSGFSSNGGDYTFLDLGCSGGQLVKDFLDLDYIAVGLEGSDYSLIHKRANWPDLANKHLFTCDISKPFQILCSTEYTPKELGMTPIQFKIVTMWEVIEHIKTSDLDTVMNNVLKHLQAGGYFVASTSDNSVIINGLELHQTRWSHEQWKNYMSKFSELQWVDFPLKPSQYVRNYSNCGGESYLTYQRIK